MYNRKLFTIEQQQMLDGVIRNGHWHIITSVFPITDPEQEYEIARLIKEHGPVFKKAVPSKVQEELAIELSKNPQLFNDPAVEAEWQAKLDEEANKEEKKARGKEEKTEEVKEIKDEVAEMTEEGGEPEEVEGVEEKKVKKTRKSK